jgi:hypothetical protein
VIFVIARVVTHRTVYGSADHRGLQIIKIERALQANASPVHNHRQPGTEIVCLAAGAMIDFQ